MAADAQWIITGDRHLLGLRRHAESTIISLADFLTELDK
jgi:predicted nucleic acid-binding protein